MSGITSKGVEVYFPLSPKQILIMCDGEYHKEFTLRDRRYTIMDEVEMIEYYNDWCTRNSSRCVFSINSSFDTITKMLKRNSKVFDAPKTGLLWGGKEFFPE